jgi:hypothetical protein
MTREERLCLLHLNKQLFEIEKKLQKEALEVINNMDKRVNNENDWISDYEIEAEISFYLREDDPAYSDKDDNILAVFSECLSILKYANHSLLASEENWNDFGLPDIDNPDQNEHHHWFYHQLYDHTKIKWEDMLRIGDIWVDIKITLQHHLRLA